MERPNIYSYDDFRLFLGDRYKQLKTEDPTCSARTFAARAGFSNPGFVNDVIKGRRTLSKNARMKLVRTLGLAANEQDYFDLLVEYGQAKKEPLRQELYRKIVFCRSRSRFARLNPALSRYYQDYRYPLVYNAIMACDFRGDFDRLARFINPPLAPSVVARCVRELCDWGLVTQDPSGHYAVTERFVEPPSTLREHVRQLNREWISHGIHALMTLPPSRRHVSSMLLSTTPEVARAVAEKIETFRKEIWEMVEKAPQDPSCIMQLNLQYFPRSRNKDEQ